LVLVLSAVVRVRNIDATLPYFQHADERTMLRLASAMLHRGTFNPEFFKKPTLPIYATAAAMVVGSAISELALGAPERWGPTKKDRGFYGARIGVALAKYLYALLSVGALGLTGALAHAITKRPVLLWLSPLLCSVSPTFCWLSWSYLNVDIVGAFFAMSTVCYLVHSRARDLATGRAVDGRRRALAFGVLAGLTVGSKYNLFPILVPCALWFWFYERERAPVRVLLLGATALLTFVVTTPYAVLAPTAFARGLVFEARHYALGLDRAARVTERGWPMLRLQLGFLAECFGWLALAVATYGALSLARRERRTLLLVVAFPLLLTGYMCAQRVFFPRNLVSVHLFIGLFAAVGVVALCDHVVTAARRVALRGARQLAVALVSLVLALSLPWSRTAAAQLPDDDPRKQVASWVLRHTERTNAILVHESIDFAPSTVKRKRLERVPPTDTRAFERWARRRPRGPGVAIVPFDSAVTVAHALGGKIVKQRFERRSPSDPGRIEGGSALRVIRF
jgi:hypothetical protein